MKNKKLILIISIVVGIILLSVGGFLLYKYIEIKNAVVKVVLKDNLEADFADTLRVSSFIESINGKIVDDYYLNTDSLGKKKIDFDINIMTFHKLAMSVLDKKNINYIVKLLEILKEKYDYIIIDTSAECFFDINKTIINKSDINIFLLEANLLEITKATKLLEIYNKNWNIDERKIKIVINKYNKNAISMNIIKKLFSDYEIIGKLEMSNIYNNIINKNNKIIFKNYKNNNEYKKINEKIIKVDFKNSKIKNLINSYLKR